VRRAAVVAATFSGVPSTVWSIARRADPLVPSLAAGRLLLPQETRRGRLMLSALVSHSALSLGWTIAIDRVLPARWGRGAATAGGALAGLAIAALDLGVVGRRVAPIAALPQGPQIADHVAFGAVAGWALR
jgi:hypothetical protein